MTAQFISRCAYEAKRNLKLLDVKLNLRLPSTQTLVYIISAITSIIYQRGGGISDICCRDTKTDGKNATGKIMESKFN